MEEGYLIIETNAEHPQMVRIHTSDAPPAEPGPEPLTGPRVRYAARFNDLSAALMQTHTRLRHCLVDVETGLYRSDPITAISAAQSVALRHRQVYLDPEISENRAFAKAISRHQWRHRLADRFWQAVGAIAVLFLLVKLLFGF
jgi:hypothetical protein